MVVTVTNNNIEQWLQALGYDGSIGVVHRSLSDVRSDHPYAREIDLMLRKDGEIGSAAVYDVDQVPTVCFIESPKQQTSHPEFVDEIRRKIWNQNLVSIVVVIQGNRADILPAPRLPNAEATLTLSEASPEGQFSATEIASGKIYTRLPDWFNRKHRIDRVLLDNLSAAVDKLIPYVQEIEKAQLLLGKCIFVSYLEDRGIVGDRYRERHKAKRLRELLEEGDGPALHRLFKQFKSDFNGDFFAFDKGVTVDWRQLQAPVFDLLGNFLKQTHIRSGQLSLWPYDFKYIPVELISGIYESFLGQDVRDQGVVYTPRHLAVLAVDEAFSDIDKPWEEVVLDGACGSGILLTSAYRRMIRSAQSNKRTALTYQERLQILLSGIRGGDISPAACKVTAFSLYLALLEDLAPNDIVCLQEDDNVKLPELIDNILTPEDKGDFFERNNPIAQEASATIIISNPPWYEPQGNEQRKRYEAWWEKRMGTTLPRRQIALAFAQRATDMLKPEGRLCLILPAVILGAVDSHVYLKRWFDEFQPQRIFNLADMRRLLFDGAIHPTVVMSGVKRPLSEQGRIPPREHCDYLVPKADISLAFGRLTIHSSDRKRLWVHAICQDAEILRTYFWGNELDESLIARLRLIGTLHHHSTGKNARFIVCKGFHLTDKSKEPIKATPLRKYNFLSTAIGASDFPKDRMFITAKDLTPFPADIRQVADYGSNNGDAFEGVRVIFTDGADTNTLEVRACYANQPFCFKQTVGAIVDRKSDEKLMQFLAVYLRSKLARYLLFYTTFSLIMERPHVKLKEIKGLPFHLPEQHPDPDLASDVIDKVYNLLKPYRRVTDISNDDGWDDVRKQLDTLVFDYFGLSTTERIVVNETCDYFIPGRQPGNFSALENALVHRPLSTDMKVYTKIFRDELDAWRDRLEGEGNFQVVLMRPESKTVGSIAIVRISIEEQSDANRFRGADKTVASILSELRGSHLYPHAGDETLSMVSDFLIHHEGALYLVKPLIKRLWLASAAAHDAFRIVQWVRGNGEVY